MMGRRPASFPWAYHGTLAENLPSIETYGLHAPLWIGLDIIYAARWAVDRSVRWVDRNTTIHLPIAVLRFPLPKDVEGDPNTAFDPRSGITRTPIHRDDIRLLSGDPWGEHTWKRLRPPTQRGPIHLAPGIALERSGAIEVPMRGGGLRWVAGWVALLDGHVQSERLPYAIARRSALDLARKTRRW
jgi:hypothetical protein